MSDDDGFELTRLRLCLAMALLCFFLLCASRSFSSSVLMPTADCASFTSARPTLRPTRSVDKVKEEGDGVEMRREVVDLARGEVVDLACLSLPLLAVGKTDESMQQCLRF